MNLPDMVAVSTAPPQFTGEKYETNSPPIDNFHPFINHLPPLIPTRSNRLTALG